MCTANETRVRRDGGGVRFFDTKYSMVGFVGLVLFVITDFGSVPQRYVVWEGGNINGFIVASAQFCPQVFKTMGVISTMYHDDLYLILYFTVLQISHRDQVCGCLKTNSRTPSRVYWLTTVWETSL